MAKPRGRGVSKANDVIGNPTPSKNVDANRENGQASEAEKLKEQERINAEKAEADRKAEEERLSKEEADRIQKEKDDKAAELKEKERLAAEEEARKRDLARNEAKAQKALLNSAINVAIHRYGCCIFRGIKSVDEVLRSGLTDERIVIRVIPGTHKKMISLIKGLKSVKGIGSITSNQKKSLLTRIEKCKSIMD